MNYCCICGEKANHPQKSFHCMVDGDTYHYCHKHSFVGKKMYTKIYPNSSIDTNYMKQELLYAKDAIFRLIGQFHRASRFDDGELYIYNYCESALERAFNVLGIEENHIKLIDFCKLWEDNSRAIWAINFSDEPYRGITADENYKFLKEDLERWERWEAEEDE